MKFLKAFLLFILSCSFCFAVSYVGKYSFTYKIIIGSVSYFIIAVYLLRKYAPLSKYHPFFILVAPIILLVIPLHIYEFKETLISLPSTIFLLTSLLFAYIFFKAKHWIAIVIPIGFMIVYFYLLQPAFYNYLYYRSYTQKTEEALKQFSFVDSLNNKYNNENIDDTVVLDFWNSKCGPCYKQFPIVDSIYKKKKSRYSIYTVNVPLNGEGVNNKRKLLSRFNYTFPQLYSQNDSILKTLGVYVFPTTLVITKSSIIYRGDFVNAIEFLDKE